MTAAPMAETTAAETTAAAHLSSATQGTTEQLLDLTAKVNGERAAVLIDCGASENFISQSFAERLKLRTDRSQARLLC